MCHTIIIMVTHFSENKSGAVIDTNLDGVLVDTDGAKLETRDFRNISAFATVSGAAATSTVTINIEGSPTGLFTGEEVELDSTTYTYAADLSGGAVSTVFSTSAHVPFTRATATSLSGADVTVNIVAGN